MFVSLCLCSKKGPQMVKEIVPLSEILGTASVITLHDQKLSESSWVLVSVDLETSALWNYVTSHFVAVEVIVQKLL